MSRYLYVTHTHPLNPESENLLLESGYYVRYTPLIRAKYRAIAHPLKRDFVILSSFSAIEYAHSMLSLFKKIYCIGRQTYHHTQSYCSDSSYIYHCSHNAPSLINLFQEYQREWISCEGTWYGSSAGLMKHTDLVDRFRNIDFQISHWNWPDYQRAHLLSHSVKEGIIVCSSLSSALAIRSAQWSESVRFIVSSERLKKIISLTSCKNIKFSSNWIKELTSEQL